MGTLQRERQRGGIRFHQDPADGRLWAERSACTGRRLRSACRKLRAAIREQCPLGRFGTPEEAAGPVLFFCSPLSDYVTGEILLCAGDAELALFQMHSLYCPLRL